MDLKRTFLELSAVNHRGTGLNGFYGSKLVFALGGRPRGHGAVGTSEKSNEENSFQGVPAGVHAYGGQHPKFNREGGFQGWRHSEGWVAWVASGTRGMSKLEPSFSMQQVPLPTREWSAPGSCSQGNWGEKGLSRAKLGSNRSMPCTV